MLLVDDLAAGGTRNLRHTPRGLVTLRRQTTWPPCIDVDALPNYKKRQLYISLHTYIYIYIYMCVHVSMFVRLYFRTSDIYLISLVSLDPSGFHLRTK